jgi:hypothetical protein
MRTPPPETDAKRHHLVPESYMRRFSFDGRRIHVFDRKTGRFRIDVPANVAVESEFNTIISKSGEKRRYTEGRLAEVDDAGLRCADKLERGEQLTREDRWAMAFFVGFAETRGRAYRDAASATKPTEEGSRVGFVDEKFADAFSAMVGVTLEPRVIESIVLEEMNDVLEVLEQAEREKTADEREIEHLRRQLRQMMSRPPQQQQPREPREQPPREQFRPQQPQQQRRRRGSAQRA